MSDSTPISESEDVWAQCCDRGDVDTWVEYLDRLDLCDHLEFIAQKGATRIEGKHFPLEDYIRMGAKHGPDGLEYIRGEADTIEERLAAATLLRWQSALERLVLDCPDSTLPARGVLQYFADDLVMAVLVEYRRIGPAVELLGMLAVPSPVAFADPLHALQHARTPTQLSLIRRSMYSRHKILVHRNVLLHVDRDTSDDVFGPSIDTLLLNDWLMDKRYRSQRVEANQVYYEPALSRPIAEESLQNGSTFLEIGCGNGLLTATYVRNEARIRRFAAMDLAMAAVDTTYRNSAYQRRLSPGRIGDRGRYMVAQYALDAVPSSNDLVVCNPPYIPRPPNWRPHARKRLARATFGTELLTKVVGDSDTLLSSSGMLAIVISEMTEPELLNALPDAMECTKVRSIRVPLRIDALDADRDADAISWLISERGLSPAEGEGEYEHAISVYLIERKKQPS